jgi:integrase
MTFPTLTEFFNKWYIANRLQTGVVSTRLSYEEVLRLWDSMFAGVPINEIKEWHLLTFQKCLANRAGNIEEKVSPNTIRSKMNKLQVILAAAGPAIKGRALTAKLLTEVPFVPVPKPVYRDPSPARVSDVVAVYNIAHEADFPTKCNPELFWKALLSVAMSTAMRYSQLMRIEWDMIRWDDNAILTPARMNKKSRRDEWKPLHDIALRDLERLAQIDKCVFWHGHDPRTIYRELDRLNYLADIPKVRRFKFHAIRRMVLLEVAERNSMAAVSLAGHQSILTTARHYVNSRNTKKAINDLDFWATMSLGPNESSTIPFKQKG